MRTMLIAAVAIGGAAMFSAPASAAFPLDRPGVESGVHEARDGCGRGWARNRWGRCRPMIQRFWPPRRVIGRPPGFYDRPAHCWRERTPWGMRRVCR